MAVEKGKVLAKLESLFEGKSITKNFKENLASKWADKIDTDEDIETYIKDREDVILEASSEADRRVSLAEKARKEAEKAKQDPAKAPEKEETKIPDDTPEYMKAFMNELKSTREEIAAMKAEKNAESIKSRFMKDERLKDVPDFIKSKYVPTSESELETAAATLQAEFSTYAKEAKIQSFGQDNPSGKGQPPANEKQASKGEVDAVLAHI